MDEIAKTSAVDSGILSSSHDTGGIGKVLLRWMWLPILGSVIGAAIGVAYVVQLPNQYKATAQVQVISPPTEILIANRTDNKDTSFFAELA
ncbi:MAG TPA: Wzz/FepE/Etk N-terminal domain-containing protein, partial [Pirellula sp.]|nr:Wzz/FepE/Etk N-terminal domain-containing protein [Pirellula sp.]